MNYVWAVMIGEYEDYGVGKIFSSREEAQKYADYLNVKHPDYAGVSSYPLHESAEMAIREDDRLSRLSTEDHAAWLKEVTDAIAV